ncbi:MAG: hypothetical protein RQ735_12200 [Flavobacteriaceae bacterium]|nr:hypothetical protein [Flavobacteriaceae bacterium]
MNSEPANWTKAEIKTYILLLCARADAQETEAEINLVKSSTDPAVFDEVYETFQGDDEESALKKIELAINNKVYGDMEISALRKEMLDVFAADNNYNIKEQYLDKLLDHIIY